MDHAKQRVTLADAPGCIGSPVIRAQNLPSCARDKCIFTGICKKLATARRAQLFKVIGEVTDLSKTGSALDGQPARKKRTAPIINHRDLSAKGADLVSSIKRAGLDRASLLDIVQSSDDIEDRLSGLKPGFLATALRALWDTPSLQKRELKARFEDSGMAALTAQSHVSIVVSALVHLNVVKDEFGTLTINGDAS